jgi:hypothetical protein
MESLKLTKWKAKIGFWQKLLMPSQGPVKRPAGLDLGQTNTHGEGPVVVWMRGHGLLPLRWIAGPFQRYIRNPDPEDWWFSNVVAIVAANRLDKWHAVLADDFVGWWPNKTRTPGQAYVDFTNVGGIMDGESNYSGGGKKGKWRLHWGGDENSAANRLLTSSERIKDGESTAQDYPIPKGAAILECRAAGHNFNSPDRMPTYQIAASAACQVPVEFEEAGIDLTLYDDGVNPVTALIDFLCDKRNGRGWNPDRFDIAQIVSVADDFASNEFAISPSFSDRKSADNWADELLETFSGFDRRGRLWQIGYVPQSAADYGDAGDGTVTELSFHDFTRSPDLARVGGSNTVSNAIGTCRDRAGYVFKEVTFGARLPMRQRRQFIDKPKQINYPHFVNPNQAKQALARWLSYESEEPLQGKIWVREDRAVNPDGSEMRRGDVFWLTSEEASRSICMRILSRTNPYQPGEVEMTVKSERGTFPTPAVLTTDDSPDQSIPDVTAIEDQAIVELPWAFTKSDGIWCAALIERPSLDMTRAQIWASEDNSTYGDSPLASARFFAIAGITTGPTSGAGNATQTEITVSCPGLEIDALRSYTDAEQANDTFLIFIGKSSEGSAWARGTYEIASIGDVTADGGGVFTLSILRGRQGTFADDFEDEAPVFIIRRSAVEAFSSLYFSPSETWYFKTQPTNFAQAMSLASVTAIAITFASPPAAPSGFVGGVDSGVLADLSWTNPSGVDIAYTEIWRHDSTTMDPLSDAQKLGNTIEDQTSVTLPLLSFYPGDDVYFWIRTRDRNGYFSTFAGPVSMKVGFSPNRALRQVYSPITVDPPGYGDLVPPQRTYFDIDSGQKLFTAVRFVAEFESTQGFDGDLYLVLLWKDSSDIEIDHWTLITTPEGTIAEGTSKNFNLAFQDTLVSATASSDYKNCYLEIFGIASAVGGTVGQIEILAQIEN